MFQSFELQHFANGFLDLHNWQIIDSDFTAEVKAMSIWEAVIKIYEERNLPVARNLMLALMFFCRTRKGYTLQDIISWCDQRLPQFRQYKPDIDKYIPLI